VCLFHHAPWRTDDALDEVADRFAAGSVPVTAAFDGLVLRTGGQAADPPK
jgi:hypothetical protein